MDIRFCAERLRIGEAAIRSLVSDVSSDQATWKPEPTSWSIVEVVNHLWFEEREDFRLRLDLLLHHPGKEWPGIDPVGTVTQQKFNDRELGESMERLSSERRQSLSWLAQLEDADWSIAYQHPQLGPIRAGDLLASWVDHDFLHVRQLARLHHEWVGRHASPYSTGYAGGW